MAISTLELQDLKAEAIRQGLLKPEPDSRKIDLLEPEDKAAIDQSLRIAEAEAKAQADAPPESKRLFKLQEIRIDQFTTLRRRVLLTPSMCRARGCGFDASKEIGIAAGWSAVEHDQRLPSGKTVGQAILGVLQYHMDTAHSIDESHIMTEDQVKKQKQWAGVPGHFLTNPGRT